jgi:hypothetical protein
MSVEYERPSPAPAFLERGGSGVVTTFARTDTEDGQTLYVKGEWCANAKSFSLLVITADGEAAWEARGITQPSNVQYDNWYERAVAALTGVDTESYFTFSFYEDDEEEEEEEGATMSLKWTWQERVWTWQERASGATQLLDAPASLLAPAELKGAKRVGVAKLRRREFSSAAAMQLLAAVMQRNEVGAGQVQVS